MITDSASAALSETPRVRSLAVISLGVGALLLVVSACVVVTFLVVPFLLRQDALAVNTAVLSIAAILIVYGALLILIGRALEQDKLRAPFRLPAPYWILGAFFLVLILGQIILVVDAAPAYLFPLWHVLASLLFPLAALAYATQQVDFVSTRSVLAQFAWGGLVTIALALVLELVIGGFLAILALLGLAVVLGPDEIAELLRALRTVPTDTQRIGEIVLREPLSALIAGGTALTLVVILVPLLEELLKGAGAAILIVRRTRSGSVPTRGNVLLWGLAAGAGFAFSENMLNGQGTLNNANGLTGIWAGAMILRAGTTMMHLVATATVAIGWYQALVEHKLIRLPLLLLVAVLMHAIWNSAALLLAGVSASTGAGTRLADFSVLLGALVLGLLAFLFVGCLFWLRALLQWARRSADSTTP
ncbi:MAG: PrsW family intramembrane metalloprotease [Chloroflexi bacterium]|nr:PrsW family intramembrane metalloprotease [Chloroflexota bacterium]